MHSTLKLYSYRVIAAFKCTGGKNIFLLILLIVMLTFLMEDTVSFNSFLQRFEKNIKQLEGIRAKTIQNHNNSGDRRKYILTSIFPSTVLWQV